MIFYKNNKTFKSTQEKNITFSIFENGVVSNEDDQVTKSNECKDCFNLTVTSGALETGLGVCDFQVPDENGKENFHTPNLDGVGVTCVNDLRVFKFKDVDEDKIYYELVLVDQDFSTRYFYLLDPVSGLVVFKSNVSKEGLVSACNYRIDDFDCLLYFVPDGMVYESGYSSQLYTNVPPMLSCVVHYDKLFGVTNTNRNELVYQSNLDIRAWTDDDSSYIEFLDNGGSFTKLVIFNDYVYLFREFGITKISAYSNANDFSFTHLYTSTSRIFENSVCVCGENIFFMQRDGLHSFNGSSVSKICENYDKYFKLLDNTSCASTCGGGKYYLATNCAFDDELNMGCETGEYVNNVLFEIDVETEEVDILRGVDINKIVSVDLPTYNRIVACFNGDNCAKIGEVTHLGAIFDSVNEKYWQSFQTDLGYKGKNKKVKEIVVLSTYDCTIEITSDVESKTYEIAGSTLEQRILASVYGKNFQFTFKTSEKLCHISKPMIVFDVIS